ncbi:MAG: hypothetical protein NZ740_03335 [Kiritimatiellae bacterium]|nr:hypothetical protein [Kiritimatiellia bacterium]MDW8458124.1 hypothetical protein [Verrucomicrobiota bacterium]
MHRAVWMIVAAAISSSAWSQETTRPVLLNGAPLRGEIVHVGPEGIEVRVGDSNRLVPWMAFAPGTRLRYDPHYRANLKDAQKGVAPNRWAKPPDGVYSATPEPFAISSAQQPLAAGALQPVPADFRPLTFQPLHHIGVRRRGELVPLEGASDVRSVSWALQYGPSASDWVLFVLEPAAHEALPAAMHLWSASGRNVERFPASRQKEGEDTRVVFRDVRLQSTREGAAVDYVITISAVSRLPGTLLLRAEVILRRDPILSSFLLLGAPSGVLTGDGSISPRDILQPPTLTFSLDNVGGKSVFAGNVRMGRLRLVPKTGMSREVEVTISEERGPAIIEGTWPAGGEQPTDKNTFVVPLDKLKSGGKYALKAKIDLGPFIGPLDYTEHFVMP